MAFVAQWKVIVPAGMVSGVGEKEVFAIVIVVECPPGGGGGGGGGGGLPPYPVLLLLHAAATAIAAIANQRDIRMTPPRGKRCDQKQDPGTELYPGAYDCVCCCVLRVHVNRAVHPCVN